MKECNTTLIASVENKCKCNRDSQRNLTEDLEGMVLVRPPAISAKGKICRNTKFSIVAMIMHVRNSTLYVGYVLCKQVKIQF